jgi:hypothetical protein
MLEDDDNRIFAASRRQLIFGAALTAGLAGGAGLIPRSVAAAQSKLSQSDSGYQARPSGGQRCEVCANWQAPSSCKVVSGPISPSGWCSLFAARKS